MSAKKNNISFGLFALAIVFLFNPNLAIIDPLPDFIGYILLSVALTKVTFLSETLYDAKRAFERMVIIDVGKVISIFWIFGMDAISERNTSLLLWSFIFGVLEIAFAIPAFVKLFDGLAYLGNFYPNTSIHGGADLKRKRSKKRSYTDSAKIFTVFFVISKAVLSFLPEIASLGESTYDETSRLFNMYRYIGVLRGFCILPIFIVGALWLFTLVRYFVRISKDRELIGALNDAYSQKQLTKCGAFVIKDVKIAGFFMVIAAVFSIDFNLDGINVLPDIIVVIALGISLFYFSKTAKFNKLFSIITFVLFAIFTLFEDYVRYYFAYNFYYNAIEKNGKAFAFYLVTVIAVAIEGALLVLIYVAMAKAVRSVVSEHTGYVLGKEIESDAEKTQILAVQKRLNKNFSVLADVAILVALSETFVSLYGAFYAFLNKNFGWMSLIGIIFGLLLIGMTVKAVSELKEAVQTKYMLE